MIGKYIELKDSYKSITEAFIHAGTTHNCAVKVKWIHAENITAKNVKKQLKDLDGVLVAPGFGDRGIEGKILAIKYVRENIVFPSHVDYNCFGMFNVIFEKVTKFENLWLDFNTVCNIRVIDTINFSFDVSLRKFSELCAIYG